MQRVLESLFSSEGEFVFVYDRDLRLVFVSSAGARLLGRKPDELIGRLLQEIVPQEVSSVERLHNVIATKRTAKYVREFEGRCIAQSITPILGDGDEVELVVAAGRDISEQRIAEQRAGQLQMLTARLASTLSRDEIADVVIDQLHGYLGAAASVAYFASEDGTMRLSASRGLPAEVTARRAVLPLDAPLPLAYALSTESLIWFEERESLVASFPHVAASQVSDVEAILLDRMMPRCNGAEFRARQREVPALAEIPVVLLTADARREEKVAATGAQHYLPKPVSRDTLCSVVRSICPSP